MSPERTNWLLNRPLLEPANALLLSLTDVEALDRPASRTAFCELEVYLLSTGVLNSESQVEFSRCRKLGKPFFNSSGQADISSQAWAACLWGQGHTPGEG